MDETAAKPGLEKFSFLQQRLRIGWGTARVAVGMAFGNYVYDGGLVWRRFDAKYNSFTNAVRSALLPTATTTTTTTTTTTGCLARHAAPFASAES